MAKLTEDQITNAKAWLHDIFVLADSGVVPKRAIAVADYYYMYGDHNYYKNRLIPHAKTIYNGIKFRQVNVQVFLEIEKALQVFENQKFVSSLATTYYRDCIKKNASMYARYIAWFCKNYEFWWNDENVSQYEWDEIKKSILGKALWEEGCFISQPLPGASKTRTPRATTNTQGTQSATSVAGNQNQPKNPYKARGPLSNSAVDLLSTPNQKEHLAGPVVFCINGLDANGAVLEDTAYIRPVEADKKTQAKFMSGTTNKVLFGSAKGYGYCPIYFETQAEANDFYAKLQASGIKVNPKVVAMSVCKKKVLSNGYFKIGTEFGPAYVSAEKLNESIQEELLEETTTSSNKEKWERMEDAFYHEL